MPITPADRSQPMTQTYAVRPFLPGDTAALCELFAQSIDELCTEDYDDDQRLAWISRAADAKAFGAKLGAMTTLVIKVASDYGGFAALKDNTVLDMLYVNPHYAGEGIGAALAEAMEKLAAARGAKTITVDSSETAVMFFEARGYVASSRNLVPIDDQWLTNTTLVKPLVKLAPPVPTKK
jgi:putative acetyltransferase